MPKPFLTFNDQINHLKNNKNLIIGDTNYAMLMLQKIGYFSLIGGYKTPFKNTTTKRFNDDTYFESIVSLYNLDGNLRELFLKYILQIERHIRSLLSYYFTEKYGENQSHYLNTASYTSNSKYKAEINRLIGTLSNLALNNSDYPYINHQRNTYNNVPLWVLVNGITFGTLSKFYSYLTPDLRVKISKNYDKVNEKQLEQYLTVITKFRNVCAHNERLYSYQTRNDIPNTTLHKKLNIPLNGAQYNCGKRDLFAVVLAFRYLLPNSEFKQFKSTLLKIINNYIRKPYSLSETDLYKHTGFPNNWRKITSYKK